MHIFIMLFSLLLLMKSSTKTHRSRKTGTTRRICFCVEQSQKRTWCRGRQPLGLNMNIAIEAPVKCCPKSLDLASGSCPARVCCKYELSVKKVLPFSSVEPKVLKRGIVKNCLNCVLEKPCLHSTKESFGYQASYHERPSKCWSQFKDIR